jgi:hypothetical protein
MHVPHLQVWQSEGVVGEPVFAPRVATSLERAEKGDEDDGCVTCSCVCLV